MLGKYAKDSRPEIAETCELSLAKLEFCKQQQESKEKADGDDRNVNSEKFGSVDPAPPLTAKEAPTVEKLRDILLDTK